MRPILSAPTCSVEELVFKPRKENPDYTMFFTLLVQTMHSAIRKGPGVGARTAGKESRLYHVLYTAPIGWMVGMELHDWIDLPNQN